MAPVRDSSVKRWSRAHTLVYRLTGGKLGRRLVGNDMLLLTTIGRRTGNPHTVPLLYLTEGQRLVVIASYGGRDRYPDWYLNLTENPLVTVQAHRFPREMVARTAGAEERAAWWPGVVEAYEGYRDYQRRTDRLIPIVFLEPLS